MMKDILEYNFFKKYKLIIFDLDDTLYPEQDYLFASYNSIARFVSGITGGDHNVYYDYLKNSFLQDGRIGLFNSFIERFGLNSRVSVDDMLIIMRSTHCSLHLYNKAELLLSYLNEAKIGVAILTNGNIIQQKNKITSLMIEEFCPSIKVYYASDYEPKPSPKGVLAIIKDFNVLAKDVMFVGDSSSDYEAASSAGVSYCDSKFLQK